MANHSPRISSGAIIGKQRPSVQKRRHESNKLEKRQEKAARKARRLAAAAEARASREAGVDPDLVGIRPGPQPIPEDPFLDIDEA